MKAKLKALLKRNRALYMLYFHAGSFLLRLLGLFIKTDPNLILFISYGGQKYDDSPRVVYEYLLEHPVSDSHRYVWAFLQPDSFPQVPNRIKVDTLRYYVTALKADCWITNSTASRGLNFKKKQTKNVLFTHGMTGMKKIGNDNASPDKAFRSGFHEQFDLIFLEGKKESQILTHAWDRDPGAFRVTGLPRNDDLAQVLPQEVEQIKKRMGLPLDKQVILYAPTFREFTRAADGRNALGIPMDFTKWEQFLGDRYVLLITAHYEVAKLLNELPANGFVFNAFQYPVLNDLLKVADLLISDYSSVVFDYSILEKPILCYGYDCDVYARERGLYVDLDEFYSHGALRTEDQLLQVILTMDYEAECCYTRQHIKEPYIAAYGNAAEAAVREIFGTR